ncbi:zinc ribbon domain-containing protein [Alkalicoccus halolimnae]|uniref:Zinc ribbon domain-containing protein n=1 Tax=Alkalicoccus halolimnae TaxID=1667239 RepID=A0A5C7FJ93_9BACI|nr:zinc ribbon domain-containing protein [Alkalicoccus halolimnae]TXF85496.1 zinc ribbon domain-containing protein [Alkalicoccus halolimnae]
MHCRNCGAQNEAEDKFCGTCGSHLVLAEVTSPQSETSPEAEAGAAPAAEANPSEQAKTSTMQSVESLLDKPYVEKGKEVGKNYGSYLLASLKAPVNHAKSIDQAGITNGLITMALFAFFLPLSLYITANSVQLVSLPFGTVVVRPTIVLFITLLATAGVTILSLKMMKVNSSYKVLINRLGSLLVIPMGLVVSAFVLALLSINILSSFTVMVAAGLVPLSMLATIFSYDNKNTDGVDSFYGVLIAMVGFTILLAFISYVLLEAMMTGITNQIPDF